VLFFVGQSKAHSNDPDNEGNLGNREDYPWLRLFARTLLCLGLGMSISACSLTKRLQSDGTAETEAPKPVRVVATGAHPAMAGQTEVGPRLLIPRSAPPIHPQLSLQIDASGIKQSLDNLVQLAGDGETSLWPDLSRSFELDHHLNQRAVQEAVRKFTRNPQWLADAQERLSLYLPYFLTEVQRRNLPAELALLPILESTLNPAALSPRGALGLWQFMPDTANRFGLSRDWWHDSRMDTVAATRAALDYLELLHAQFGDWLLSMAAYNAGEGTVARTLPASRGHTDSTRFFNLHGLPSETRTYVPRILALAAIIKNPEAYDIVLPDVARDVRFEAITLDKAVDLNLAASVLNVPPAELVALNPGFHRRATPPNGTHNLLVPAHIAGFAEARLDAIAKDGLLAPVVDYRVQSGDSLSRIAKTFNSSVAAIKSLNGLRSDRIVVNAMLRVPRAVGGAPPGSGQGMARDEFLQAPGSNRIAAAQQSQRATSHVVKRGEPLGMIARRFNTSVPALMQANGLSSHKIQANHTLHIPGSAAMAPLHPAHIASNTGSSQTLRSAPAARAGTSSIRATTAYKVRKGDTLSTIASRHGITVTQLRTMNGLSRDAIRTNQTLRVPTSAAATAALVAGTANHLYRIRNGDTLWSIARRYAVSSQELMRANGLRPNSVLRIGNELRIPQPAPTDIAGG